MKKFGNLFLLMTFFSGSLIAQEEPFIFSVRHDHFWGSGTGELIFSTGGVVYRSEDDEEHAREWDYEDIQEVKIASPTKVEILTYEDVKWKLNADRKFKFEISSPKIGPEAVRFLRQHATRSVISAVFTPSEDIYYTVSAKHRHSLGGGCDGQLLFDERGLYYRSSKQKHSRFWPLNVIKSVGRQSDFDFRITVSEQNLLGETRNFQFQLKRPLDQKAYEQLWRQLHEPESWLSRSRGNDHSGF